MDEREEKQSNAKFGWSNEDAAGLKIEKAAPAPDKELAAEIEKVDAQLKAAGLSDEEIDRLADEPDDDDYNEDD